MDGEKEMKKNQKSKPIINNSLEPDKPTKALLKNDSIITITHVDKTHVFGTVDGQPYSIYIPKDWVKKWIYKK